MCKDLKIAYHDLGRRAEAKADFKKALDLDLSFKMALKIKKV